MQKICMNTPWSLLKLVSNSKNRKNITLECALDCDSNEKSSLGFKWIHYEQKELQESK